MARLGVALLLLLAATAAPGSSAQPAAGAAAGWPGVPPFDGSGNNRQNPSWGAAYSAMVRQPVTAVGYEDGRSVMPERGRPSPRAISTALSASPYVKSLSSPGTSKLLTVLGQYVTEEITKSVPFPGPADSASTSAAIALLGGQPSVLAAVVINATNGTASSITDLSELATATVAAAPISIPAGDAFFSNFTLDVAANSSVNGGVEISPVGTRTALPFTRSLFRLDPVTGVRQPINTASAFIDASAVYGASADDAARLRAGTAGLLRDDGNRGLPLNAPPQQQQWGLPPVTLINVTNEAMAAPSARMRAAGFPAVNQNPGLLTMATLWLREHNRRAALAAQAAVALGALPSDEQLFQTARKWVAAQLSHIVFDEYLPQLLGELLPAYTGYNPAVNPGIDVLFATGSYRYGHSALTDLVQRLGEDWLD